MNQIINNIVNWFSKKHKNNNTNINKLIFSVDDTGKILLDFELSDLSTKGSDAFGLMLYCVNEGLYVKTILDLLNYIGSKNSSHIDFTNNTIYAWSDCISKYGHLDSNSQDINDSPLVQPSQFYKGIVVHKN